MILTTTETAPGHRVVAVKGLVQGNTIRARHIGRDIMAGLRNIVGGEISEYTRLMTESRMQSTHRMIEEAEALGANAVIGVRFVTSMVISGASELLAYGTAVVVEDEPQEQAADEAPGEDEASSQDEGNELSASAQDEDEEPSEATAEAQDEGDEPSASGQDEGEEPSEAAAEAQDEGDEPSASGQDEGEEPSEAAVESQDEGDEPARPAS